MISRMCIMRTNVHRINKLVHFRRNSAFIESKRWSRCQMRSYSTTIDEKKIKVVQEDDEINDKPITYSTSRAADWTSRQSFGELPEDQQPPTVQVFAVVLSLFAFLVYFCILREENDIDKKITVPMYKQVEGFEEANIRRAINSGKKQGLDTRDLEARLQEIVKLRS